MINKPHLVLLHCYTLKNTREERSNTEALLYKAAKTYRYNSCCFKPYLLGNKTNLIEIIEFLVNEKTKPTVITNNYRLINCSTGEPKYKISTLIKKGIIEVYQLELNIKLRKIKVNRE